MVGNILKSSDNDSCIHFLTMYQLTHERKPSKGALFDSNDGNHSRTYTGRSQIHSLLKEFFDLSVDIILSCNRYVMNAWIAFDVRLA